MQRFLSAKANAADYFFQQEIIQKKEDEKFFRKLDDERREALDLAMPFPIHLPSLPTDVKERIYGFSKNKGIERELKPYLDQKARRENLTQMVSQLHSGIKFLLPFGQKPLPMAMYKARRNVVEEQDPAAFAKLQNFFNPLPPEPLHPYQQTVPRPRLAEAVRNERLEFVVGRQLPKDKKTQKELDKIVRETYSEYDPAMDDW